MAVYECVKTVVVESSKISQIAVTPRPLNRNPKSRALSTNKYPEVKPSVIISRVLVFKYEKLEMRPLIRKAALPSGTWTRVS